MRICPLDAARGLREDGLVGRAAAAADRAAAAVEEAKREPVPLRQRRQARLGLVELPDRGEEAAVLVAVGVAEHHLDDAPPAPAHDGHDRRERRGTAP